MPTRIISHNQSYGVIRRGSSLSIPVTIRTPEELPIDLTGLNIAFTVKKQLSDFDRDDVFAYIAQDFEPQYPEDGHFFICLSSQDTDFEPGHYFFDIVLKDPATGMVHRLVSLGFQLSGGPTNRLVNSGKGQFPVGDEITIIHLTEGTPIIIIAPMVMKHPEFEITQEEINLIYGKIEGLQKEIEELRDLLI